jgi:hypothetical protein
MSAQPSFLLSNESFLFGVILSAPFRRKEKGILKALRYEYVLFSWVKVAEDQSLEPTATRKSIFAESFTLVDPSLWKNLGHSKGGVSFSRDGTP